MKNCTTIPASLSKKQSVVEKEEKKFACPSEKTLAFLKLFARNYQVEKELPEGLQEIILG